MKTSPELRIFIDLLTEDLRPIVASIERSPKTTQDHYDRYMELLSQLSKGEKKTAMIFCIAMINAGANTKGIVSAMKILFG